jgi:hypothetical protein
MLASGLALSAPGPRVGGLGWTLWGFCLSAAAAAAAAAAARGPFVQKQAAALQLFPNKDKNSQLKILL